MNYVWILSALLKTAICLSSVDSMQMPLSDGLGACSILDFQLPGRVSFPNSDAYKSQINSYYASNQGEIESTCRITPQSSNDLQRIMLLVSQTNTTFAVNSGGHSTVPGTSNVFNGLVIDLKWLNHVTLKTESGIVDVGTGARWNDIYQELDRHGNELAVAGARAGSVGVGGYLLGGGLSVFAGARGWACDNVAFFEVVLANGTLLEVDHSSHPDLYTALKGGGSNFGIVTRVGLQVFKLQRLLHVIVLNYQVSQIEKVIGALVRYNILAAEEPEVAVSISVGGRFGSGPVSINVVISSPQDVFVSKALLPFFQEPAQIGIQGRFSQLQLARIYDNMNPTGFRQHRTTITVHNDADLVSAATKNLTFQVAKVMKHLDDKAVQGGLLIQPLTLPHLHASGENILGLQKEMKPLLLLSLELRHSSSAADRLVSSCAANFMRAVEAVASESKLYHPFRYLNYASEDQLVYQQAKDNMTLWSSIIAVKQNYDVFNVFGRQIHDPFRIE